MLGLKKKNFTSLFFGSTTCQNLGNFGTNSNIFTIVHIEFAQKSQKIRTVALWYKKRNPPPPPAPNRVNIIWNISLHVIISICSA